MLQSPTLEPGELLHVDLDMDGYPFVPTTDDEFDFVLYSCDNVRLPAGAILTVVSSSRDAIPNISDLWHLVLTPSGDTTFLLGHHYDVFYTKLSDHP
jgi:hypothetical protein